MSLTIYRNCVKRLNATTPFDCSPSSNRVSTFQLSRFFCTLASESKSDDHSSTTTSRYQQYRTIKQEYLKLLNVSDYTTRLDLENLFKSRGVACENFFALSHEKAVPLTKQWMVILPDVKATNKFRYALAGASMGSSRIFAMLQDKLYAHNVAQSYPEIKFNFNLNNTLYFSPVDPKEALELRYVGASLKNYPFTNIRYNTTTKWTAVEFQDATVAERALRDLDRSIMSSKVIRVQRA